MTHADNVADLVIEHMKRFQASLARIERTQEEHTHRLGRMEHVLARVQNHHEEDYALQSTRIDRLAERLHLIERRLELVD